MSSQPPTQSTPVPDKARITHIALDERTIVWRSADIEQERRIAILDLIEENRFRPLGSYGGGYDGPFHILMRIEEGRLAVDVAQEDKQLLETIVIALSPFRRVIRDYFAICDSYYKAVRNAPPSQIEAIDMARRAIHDQAAELLQERLGTKVEVDHDTARRLFTLICVLHIKVQ